MQLFKEVQRKLPALHVRFSTCIIELETLDN